MEQRTEQLTIKELLDIHSRFISHVELIELHTRLSTFAEEMPEYDYARTVCGVLVGAIEMLMRQLPQTKEYESFRRSACVSNSVDRNLLKYVRNLATGWRENTKHPQRLYAIDSVVASTDYLQMLEGDIPNPPPRSKGE